jgi:hypothetical protein
VPNERLSRELESTELPEHPGESLPEATPVRRQSPEARSAMGGAEHRAGMEEPVDEPPRGQAEAAPSREDPPRGVNPAGGQ